MGFVPPEANKANQQEEKKPSGFTPPEVKKKEVTATPSTPSPTTSTTPVGRSFASVTTGAKSALASTPSAVSLPNFIYNNNLNTGARPTGRGYDYTGPKPVDDRPTSVKSLDYIPDWIEASGLIGGGPAVIKNIAAPEISDYNSRVQSYESDRLVAHKIEFAKINSEQADIRSRTPGTVEYQQKLSQQFPGVAVAPEVTQENPLDEIKRFNDFYLLNTNPAAYNDIKNKVSYYSDPNRDASGFWEKTASIIIPAKDVVSDYVRPLMLQSAKAEEDLIAINTYSKATNKSLEINKKLFDESYGPQQLAYEDAYKNLQSWPKGNDGEYIVATNEEANKVNGWINTINTLRSDEGFMSSAQAVYSDEQDLDKAQSAIKQTILDNPLYFIAQNQAKQRKVQTEEDLKALGPVFEWKAKNIDNPATTALVDFAIGIAYLPKALGEGDEFGWTDDLYNQAATSRDVYMTPYLPVENSIVSKIVSSATTMALMAATGYAGGAAIGGSSMAMMAGQAAAGTVSTMEGFYRAGKEAGMSDSDAENYSIVSGLIQGMLEMVNPEAAFGTGVATRSANKYIQVLAEGGTKSFARKEATRELFRNVVGENVQELLQQTAEWGINMKANQITGANLDVGDKFGDVIIETAIITTLVSGVVGGVQGASSSNRIQHEAIYATGLKPEIYKSRVADMVVKGQITQEKAAEITAKIDDAQKVVSKIPSNISPEKAVQLIPKIQEKIRLEDELSKSDDSLKPAVEEQIAAVSEEIRQDAGIKTTEEKAVEDQEKLVQEKEIADLNMLSTMGVITPEQQTRLNELNAKAAMAPAEATGVETKTTTDATQERIIEESRKQQYQDVEEGGLPPEASRRDITEQGGKVEEEKVSSKTTPVEEAAAAVQRSLESAGITVRTLTEEEAVAEGYSDRTQGMFEDKKGQIVVVPSRIQEGWGTTVVWHEGAHPVLNIVRNTDKPTYDAMVRGLKNLAQNATGNNKAQLDDVVKFAEEYRAERGQEGVDDESIAEFTGRVGSGMIDIDSLPKSFKQRFVDFINSMATKLGRGTVMKDTDAQTLINKAKQISDVLKSGRDIAEVVGAENIFDYGASFPESTTLSYQESKADRVNVNQNGHNLSFVKPSDIIDIDALIKDIQSKGQKVWFWVADQLGRGLYFDKVIGNEHFLDAGPSFALDPKNRDRGIVWATGKGESWINDKIANSDYIFILSGSPIKSKLFNKRVAEITLNRIKDSIGGTNTWNKFKKSVLKVSNISALNKILNQYDSFEDLLNSVDRKDFLIQIDAQSTKKGTELKLLLDKYNAFVNYDELRDGFYKDNGFDLNDIMLVLKPTGFGGKSAHSTYENDVLGSVVGVPDRKINAFDIMPDSFKAKYGDAIGRSQQSQAVAPYGAGVRSLQESRGKRMDVVADTYVQSGLTEDGNDYVFFHVSSADEKSIRKGIDSRKFYSTRTSKSEKGTQYGVASYYTKPTDGERMVGGDKYVVRVSKDKVYPMDTDPKGYKDQVEKTVPENTPFRAEVIKKKMADLAAKDGYQMAVGEWYYSRTGEKTEMPEFRADALVALKPTNESASDFVSNEESGMERIAHPEEAKYKYAAQYEALGEAAYDYLSEKGRYDDAYDIARDMYMYGKVPTEQEMKTLMKGMPKKISNMVPKTGQQSMGQRMNVAGIEYTELSIAAQETLRARRSKKSYFDDAVSKMPKSDFDKDEVERIIKEENFGIITGENPMGTPTVSSVNSKLNGKAVKWLESRGYEVAPVTGKYGQTENSFFVPGLTVADAVEFAKAFNQDSVVTNEGMVYQDGRMNPRTMNDSFNVDSSSPTEDFVSAIRTEDGNVMGFKIGIDLETKVDSSYVAQSAVDTKSTEYAKSSVDKAISERADAKVQDDADTLSAINTTAEEAKSSSIINGPTKISQLKDQVVKAVEDGLISDATAKKVVDDAIKSYDEKIAASKESIKEAIDKAKDVISKFLFNPEGQYVTNPETGEKVKISKSSIFDVEATVNFATDAIKKAVDKGVDLAVALGNFKSALSNHPTIKNNIANNVITEGEFEAMLDAEIAKLTQLYNNLNNKKTEKASKTLDRVMRSNFVSQGIKDSLESQGITYVPDTISASVSDAQAIVDYFDAEGALDILEENMANVAKSPDVMPHTRALILAEIFDKRLKVADDVANDPSSSDQAKKAAADKAANTAIAFSTINGQYAKSVSIASKRMKEIVGMSAKGLEYFVDAQVKMKSKNFVKSNRMQRKAKKAMVNAAKTGNASDSKKSIMDSLMPEYSKLDDKFKTAIDANLSNAINSNGQINKKDLENALVAYYSGMQMSEDLKKSILSHTAAIKDMEGKQKSFSKIIEEYKSALSGLDPGTPAYKAVVDKYEKMAEDAAEAVRDADFKARLEAEIMGRKMREGRDLWQSLASIMKLNMLTPQTIIVNIVGYLPAIALRGAAVTIATPIDWSITMAMKATRSITGNKTEVSRTTRVVRDAFGGIKYGFAYGAKEGFRKIVYGSTSEDVEKYNMKHSMNAFQAWRDLFSKKSPVELNNVENKISAFIEATFGMPADAMSRMLSIGDKIPFEISKASKLSSLANETYVKNKDGSQRKMNNAERLEFIFNPPAEAAQIANDFAEKMTYQQKNVLSDMVNKAQKNIANDVSGFIEGPLGRHISGFANLLIGTVIPFTKTPVNLLTETFMFTNPALGVVYSAGYAAKSVKEERAGNEFKASYYRGESIRYFSRATVAMGVAMVAANMIKNGLMTGDEDEMKFDAKSMQYENVRARSLNLSALFRMNTGDSNWAEFRKGDFMINYSKLGTLGLGLSAWADFYRNKDSNQIDGGLNDIMSLEGLGGISLANIKAMVDQSFMTGIAGVIDAIRDDQGNKVKKFQTNTVVGLSKIFIPNTVSAVSKASVDFTKETRTEGKDTELSDMIMNRLRVDLGITGSADELPSKITLWGEPVKSSPAGTNPWVYYLFDPVQSYSPDTESVGFKIQQSYFATPKSMSNVRNKMIPSKPDQTISINNSNVMLTGSEYEQYQILVGKTRKSMVSSYVNSDLWNQSSLEQRAEVLDSLYSQAAKIARVQFIMNTPRLMDINMGVK